MSDETADSPWIGVNFWSRSGGPRMWSRYDGALVREELAVLAAHGCTLTRSFLYWPDFVPLEGGLDEDLLARLVDFLDAHRDAGLRTIPTFLVGHMSGENWDPSWRRRRDAYRDVTFVAEQARYIECIVRRVGAHVAIAGWLISNEMPLYGGTASTEEVTAWARLMIQAVRAGGGSQPVSLGDGAWGVEVTGNDNGYSLRALAPLVDFIGPHVYPMENDAVRQLLRAGFSCALAGGFDRPVVLEEFGVTTDFATDAHAAAYYRHVLWSSALAGASGWIAWNNADYDDLADEDPYRHHPFEMHFGVTDRLGRPKPPLVELARFSDQIRKLRAAGFAPGAADVALVVPEHFERAVPFTAPAFREDVRAALFQSWIAAREADLGVAPVRERDAIPSGARLYLVPSTKLLTAPGLRQLHALAGAGALVYVSLFAGSTAEQRGSWLTWLPEVFGVRHQLRYGLVDPIEDDVVTFTFAARLGEIDAGSTLSFAAAGSESGRAFVPVEADGAEVLAYDAHGRPALLRQRVGEGALVLCTYPLEYMAASRPHANPEDTARLYDALGAAASCRRPVRVADPRVLVGRLCAQDAACFVLANSAPSPIRATLERDPGVFVRAGAPGEDGPLVSSVELAPYGVALVTLAPVNCSE